MYLFIISQIVYFQNFFEFDEEITLVCCWCIYVVNLLIHLDANCAVFLKARIIFDFWICALFCLCIYTDVDICTPAACIVSSQNNPPPGFRGSPMLKGILEQLLPTYEASYTTAVHHNCWKDLRRVRTGEGIKQASPAKKTEKESSAQPE